MWEIEFFRSESGECPFEKYLRELPASMRAKTLRSVQLLRLEGTRLREPDTKSLGNGLFELRTQAGGLQGRSVFFFFAGKRIVITTGFLKRTRKTPSREIERAQKLRADYLERCG